MRALLLVLLAATLVFADDSPPSPQEVPARLSIPAELSKTIDTDKCKAGDIVEMKTLEPVLIGKGVVMPENTKLRGRILGAASRQDEKPSWLVVVVDRADWKEHSVSLHAFIAAQITTKNARPGQGSSSVEGTSSQSENVRRRRSARELSQNNPGNDLAIAMTRPPQDAIITGKDTLPPAYHPLDDIHILRDKNGTVFLLSQKSHLKLPSGTRLMLMHQKPTSSNQSAEPKIANNPE